MTTELLLDKSGTGRQTRSFIRDGVAGNYDVVNAMVRMIRDSVTNDKGLETFAKRLETGAGHDGYTDSATILAVVYDYVKSHVKYTPDIAGRVESIKSARATLRDAYGDCDDQTVLNASLLGCLGFEHTAIAMARYNEKDTSFSHVYCVCYADDKRFVLDTTLPNGRFNDETKAVEVKEVSIFTAVQGLDGVSGFINNGKYYGKKIAKALIETAPRLADQLPLGFLASNAFANGAQMLGGVPLESVSFNHTASRVNKALERIINELLHSRIAYDLAKSNAVQEVAQLSAVEHTTIPDADYKTIRQSVQDKLSFIKEFPAYAEANGIQVVYLNPHLMLISGALLTGGVGYLFWKNYKRR